MTPAALSVSELAREAVEGESAFQHPDELAALSELLIERLPAEPRILEIGLGLGGTVWLWRGLWPSAFIAGVDRREAPCEGCRRRRAHSGCPRLRIRAAVDQFVLADSVAQAGKVHAALPAAMFDFVHIDADHSYDAVRSDFLHYAPLASSVVALHDTLAYPGVRRFLAELRATMSVEVVTIGEEPAGYGYGVILA